MTTERGWAAVEKHCDQQLLNSWDTFLNRWSTHDAERNTQLPQKISQRLQDDRKTDYRVLEGILTDTVNNALESFRWNDAERFEEAYKFACHRHGYQGDVSYPQPSTVTHVRPLEHVAQQLRGAIRNEEIRPYIDSFSSTSLRAPVTLSKFPIFVTFGFEEKAEKFEEFEGDPARKQLIASALGLTIDTDKTDLVVLQLDTAGELKIPTPADAATHYHFEHSCPGDPFGITAPTERYKSYREKIQARPELMHQSGSSMLQVFDIEVL